MKKENETQKNAKVEPKKLEMKKVEKQSALICHRT